MKKREKKISNKGAIQKISQHLFFYGEKLVNT